MKNYIVYLSFILATIVACDKIEQEDFLIAEGGGGVVVDTSTFVKKVLIEDFTGHTCQNCPEASEEIHTLQQISAYQGNVIAIAIHSGFFSDVNPTFTTDFTTDEGTVIHDFFGAASYPTGMVNRRGFNSTAHLLNYPEWGSVVADLISQEPEIGIKMSVENGTINIDAKLLEGLNDELKLVVVLTENEIIDKQLVEGQGVVEDYEHNHVLRKSLNGTWGQTVQLNTSTFETYSFDYTLDPSWDETNTNAVAYIYSEASKEVLQVEELHLTE
jgi:hypothetical protein